MAMKKRWWLLLASLGLTLALTSYLCVRGGLFRSFSPHFAGQCIAIGGMPGAEDITFHPSLGYAYVSSDDRRATMAKRPVQGAIYRFDPNSGERLRLTAAFKRPFHPHGISLFVDATGKQTLYVINHPKLGEALIEKFELGADGLLHHQRTFRDPTLVSINDLVAVDADRFYVTNDHHHPFGPRQLLEDVLQSLFGRSFSEGVVVYFDGERFREVVTGTAYANGINRSADGKTIYLAQVLAHSLSVYARDERSGALQLRKELPLHTGPDNIEVDERGELWIGAHPASLQFVAHALDGSGKTPAPSQVLHVKLSAGAARVEEVYLSQDGPLSAVATAAVHGRRMLLGPVFDAQLLSCRLP
jgi:arylesterase/paraoxonase